jgi:regulator of RNase E activity RraA
MMALRLARLGAAAAVRDAGMRDVVELRALGLPVRRRGAAAASSSATLMLVEHGRPVPLGGVTVMAGDWLVGAEDCFGTKPWRPARNGRRKASCALA